MAPSFGLPAGTWPCLAEVLYGLTGNRVAPPEVLLRLTAADIDRYGLASRGDLPPDAAAVLAGDRDTWVRHALAWNPGIPPEIQAVLAADPDPRVRAQLAEGVDGFRTVPLARAVCELLARDPEPKVRGHLAFNRQLPDDIRAALLDDGDPAAGLDGPLPAQAARTLLAGIGSAAGGASELGLVRRIAEVSALDAGLADQFLSSPGTRAAVAANPALPARHLPGLARDPDNQVRAAVAARRDLDPALRESIPVDYDDRSSAIVGWLLHGEFPGQDLAAFARSRHQVFRKTLAMRPGLPGEIIEILARDQSFAVRLFVCERQPDAPGWLPAQTAAAWTGRSRGNMLRHENFPAGAAISLARSAESADREVAAAHPGLPADAIEALLTDDHAVRYNAATNTALPVTRLTRLLAADPVVARGAAANAMLPATAMHQALDQAGL